MKKRTNYYQELLADYSKPEPVAPELARTLIKSAEKFIGLKEKTLPEIGPDYTAEQIENENKEWWPTHCEALRQARGDLLTGEYRDDIVYFCQDGPYYGLEEQKSPEKHWWALIAQPGVVMCWPIVMFHSAVSYTHLDVYKRQELIALAIGIASRCDACVGFHVKALIRLGVSRAQLMETLAVCTYMGGGPSLMYAAEAVRAYEEFSAARPAKPAA